MNEPRTLTKAELAELLFDRVGLNKREAKDMVETFFDLDEWGAFQLGASIANGQTPEQLNNQLIGFDAEDLLAKLTG